MKQSKIQQLLETLDNAKRIDESQLAEKIKAIGFKCRKCARCCREEYGDNTVFVFPSEIRCIVEQTSLNKDDFVIPTPSQDIDTKGNIHTFEWVLRKNGDCIFLQKGLCSIYENRPYICKTYPFYLLEGKLTFSECEGLGSETSDEESKRLAVLLKERYIAEIEESVELLRKFKGFKPLGKGICVHDSEGEHWV